MPQETEREHVTEGTDCWCRPVVESYGYDQGDEETDDDAS